MQAHQFRVTTLPCFLSRHAVSASRFQWRENTLLFGPTFAYQQGSNYLPSSRDLSLLAEPQYCVWNFLGLLIRAENNSEIGIKMSHDLQRSANPES
jgi:hypothetical protein